MLRWGVLLGVCVALGAGCGGAKVAIYTPAGFSGRIAPDMSADPTLTFKADDSASCGSLEGGVRRLKLRQSQPQDIQLTMIETPGEGLWFDRQLSLIVDGTTYAKGPSSTVTFEQTGDRFHGAIFGSMVAVDGEKVSLSVDYNVPTCQ